jgi:hypothetical protein
MNRAPVLLGAAWLSPRSCPMPRPRDTRPCVAHRPLPRRSSAIPPSVFVSVRYQVLLGCWGQRVAGSAGKDPGAAVGPLKNRPTIITPFRPAQGARRNRCRRAVPAARRCPPGRCRPRVGMRPRHSSMHIRCRAGASLGGGSGGPHGGGGRTVQRRTGRANGETGSAGRRALEDLAVAAGKAAGRAGECACEWMHTRSLSGHGRAGPSRCGEPDGEVGPGERRGLRCLGCRKPTPFRQAPARGRLGGRSTRPVHTACRPETGDERH